MYMYIFSFGGSILAYFIYYQEHVHVRNDIW